MIRTDGTPAESAGVSWARRGHPERHRATYTRRAGTEQLLAFYDVHGDVLEEVIHKRKTSTDILQAWKRLRYMLPRGHTGSHLVLDNLSSHWRGDLKRFARRNKISVVPTPTYASWLDLIEAQFTALERLCLSNSDDRTHLERRRRIYRYLTLRNREVASPECRLITFRRYSWIGTSRPGGRTIDSGWMRYVQGSPEFFQPFTSRWPRNTLSGSLTKSPSMPSVML